VQFKKERGRSADINAADPYEKRIAEGVVAFQRYRIQEMRKQALQNQALQNQAPQQQEEEDLNG
jgi:hypothetical protein